MQTEHSEASIMLYLISCALHDEKPDESVLEGVDFNDLLALSGKHSLSAIVYMALQNTEALLHADPAVSKRWKELKERAVRKNILMDAERRQICLEFENNQIWYMPLKGSVLKYMYPHEGMREMTDNDILYDSRYQKIVKKIFTGRGYKAESYAWEKHDVYKKEPLYCFEMHPSLLSMSAYLQLADSFDNLPEKLIGDEDSLYGRHLSDEDFYLSVTAHSYKHHGVSGTGLRSLVDFYVMNKTLGETMNREYVSSQLHRMGLDEYELTCRILSKHLFERAALIDISSLPQDEQGMLMYIISAGAFGTLENRVANSIKKCSDDGISIDRKSKIKYCFQRLFPGREWCRINSPLCYKHPFLIPFLWIKRLVRAASSGKLSKELLMITRCNDKE